MKGSGLGSSGMTPCVDVIMALSRVTLTSKQGEIIMGKLTSGVDCCEILLQIPNKRLFDSC